ncbi:MAG: BglG family transcription antiterminator [Butyricicoccus sp.]|nr:BglG family transcription antiterminator [Butyricicoccus sp.]
MLNLRQLEIILELCENPGQYVTASSFAKKQQVSLRTIQNDIKQIKNELANTDCMEFQTVARKGCRIVVTNAETFPACKDFFYKQFSSSSIYQNGRINQILQILLYQHRAQSLYDIENQIYVSHSTLLNDFKRVSEILEEYSLELLRSSNKVMVDGSEINKRQCILEQGLITPEAPTAFTQNDIDSLMDQIKNILVQTFVEFKHPVTEAALNNTILQLQVAVNRMQSWFFITPTDMRITDKLEPERQIAQAVFARISEVFHIRIPDAEVDYFALYMKGQGCSGDPEVISDEVDNLVLGALQEINETHGIDLTNNLNLRIALALHITPLIVRIKYDMQLKNHLVDYIRQTFPQGFDLGIYFAAYLQKVFHKRVSDEEIAFIAIHLYSALAQKRKEEGTKRILVISSMRQSENILLQQTLLNWLSSDIAELTFVTPSEVTEQHLDNYDLFLTTEKEKYYEIGLAFYINPFPNAQDYLNLKLAMDGFKSIDDIASIFYKELFFLEHGHNREEILCHLCQSATDHFGIEADLQDAVLQREALGSTFFGNGIAAPHPISAVSSESFVAVAVLPQAMEWDEDKNMVNLVLLVCIGKNNTKAFHLWNYLSTVFANRHFVDQLLTNPSYDTFIRLLKDTIAENFKS